MLAAASVVAVNAAVAAPPSFAAAPIEHAAEASQERPDARPVEIAVKHWLAAGAVAAALAGLIRLFGWARVSAALGQAGKAVVAAPGVAVRYVGEALKSPVRSLMLFVGLTLLAIAGVGFYDVEWLGGLLTGGALVMAGILGARRIGRIFVRR